MPTADASRSSLRSVAAVTGLSLVQLLVQFGTQLVLARLFGAGSEMDALVAALAPPVMIATVLSGSLGYVLVPVFAERLAAGGRQEATAVTGQIGLYLLVVAAIATTVVMAIARPLAEALCPGFSASDQALTAGLLKILALLIVANSLVAFGSALYHCERQFALPAAAGVAGTLVTLAYVVLLHRRQGIEAVAWGVVAGAATSSLLLTPGFLDHARQAAGRRLLPQAATRRALGLLIPLIGGAIYWRLDPLVDRWLGSFLPAGSIAHLGYAWRLAAALMMLGTSGLSIVAFPAIAARAAAGTQAELNAEIAQALRLLAFLLIPLVLGLGLFAQPVVRLLFEHGRFTAADTQAVTTLLVLYLGVVVGASAGDVLSRTLYSLHDTRTPVVISVAVFTLAIGLKFLLARQLGAAGLAAATSAYYVLNAAVLLAVLLQRLGRGMLAGVMTSIVRCTAGALAACFAAWLFGKIWTPFAAMPAVAAGAAGYFAAAWLLNDEFAKSIGQFAWNLRRRNQE